MRGGSEGMRVPNVDPLDGGVNARVLFLSESPGPKAVNSGYVSCDNPDPSARNKKGLLDRAGFARKDVVLWNVVPYCVSTETRNANASKPQIREAAPMTQTFIDELVNLEVVVFCGLLAQHARQFLRLKRDKHDIQALNTFHSGQQSFNQLHCRDDMEKKYREAYELISGQARVA